MIDNNNTLRNFSFFILRTWKKFFERVLDSSTISECYTEINVLDFK